MAFSKPLFLVFGLALLGWCILYTTNDTYLAQLTLSSASTTKILVLKIFNPKPTTRDYGQSRSSNLNRLKSHDTLRQLNCEWLLALVEWSTGHGQLLQGLVFPRDRGTNFCQLTWAWSFHFLMRIRFLAAVGWFFHCDSVFSISSIIFWTSLEKKK